jgi:Na+/proline symporter
MRRALALVPSILSPSGQTAVSIALSALPVALLGLVGSRWGEAGALLGVIAGMALSLGAWVWLWKRSLRRPGP